MADVIQIPTWFGGAFIAFCFTLLAAAIAWAIRSDRKQAVIEATLARLVALLEKHDPAVLRGDVDRIIEDIRELRAGHQRNRERIEQAYRDLTGTHVERTKP